MVLITLPSSIEEANVFLQVMDWRSQDRGKKYFRQGRVSDLQQTKDTAFSATVRGSQNYNVTLSYQPGKGWHGFCTCPVAMGCKHLYAAMQSLLAEHSAGRV